MVAGIPVLSATDFLVTLYFLEMNGWKYDSKRVKSDAPGGILVAKKEDGSYDLDHGMFSIMAALSNNGRDDTPLIRGDFLAKYGKGIVDEKLLKKPGVYFIDGSRG
ncbi:MAG: hypothetical protein AABW50_00895 [Nanoarchaeota archaeon]